MPRRQRAFCVLQYRGDCRQNDRALGGTLQAAPMRVINRDSLSLARESVCPRFDALAMSIVLAVGRKGTGFCALEKGCSNDGNEKNRGVNEDIGPWSDDIAPHLNEGMTRDQILNQ